jgi:hypothetical protein
MHFKVQTWFPYVVQIYINGREWLSKSLDKEGIKYERYENSFSHIDDIVRAQEIADTHNAIMMSGSFDAIAARVCNFLPAIKEQIHDNYYWCIDQCEYATDIMFNSRESLESFYEPVIKNAFFGFNSDKIMSFMDRKMHPAFKGKMSSQINKRPRGYIVKYTVKTNSIKMYDKGTVLRVETTINKPSEFKVYDSKKQRWKPMGKSVANIYHFAEIAKACNNRFIKAISDMITADSQLEYAQTVSKRVVVNNRPHAGLNLLSEQMISALGTIADAKFLLHGFRNKDIAPLFAQEARSCKAAKDKATRLIGKLRAHKIIQKVSNTLSYRLTSKGRQLSSELLLFKHCNLQRLTAIA